MTRKTLKRYRKHKGDSFMSIQMPPLPYPTTSLAPYISEETLNYHYGKHHKAYVDKTNAQVEGGKLDKASLTEIVKNSNKALFNTAAQAWNHEFYWNGLCPPRDHKEMPQSLKSALEKTYGRVEDFKSQFQKEALSHFGSGWAWLVKSDQEELKIISTHDADTPVARKDIPLLTCDVWEHAYYIDYRNNRGKYLESFWNLVNWEFVARQLSV